MIVFLVWWMCHVLGEYFSCMLTVSFLSTLSPDCWIWVLLVECVSCVLHVSCSLDVFRACWMCFYLVSWISCLLTVFLACWLWLLACRMPPLLADLERCSQYCPQYTQVSSEAEVVGFLSIGPPVHRNQGPPRCLARGSYAKLKSFTSSECKWVDKIQSSHRGYKIQVSSVRFTSELLTNTIVPKLNICLLAVVHFRSAFAN